MYTNGYRTVKLGGKRYGAHRIVFALTHDRWPADEIDHADGDPLNNRPENLREATRSQNRANTRAGRNNTSGVKGVHWHRRYQKWKAVVHVNGERRFLGHFDTLEAAATAYANAAQAGHGAFAKTFAAAAVTSRGTSA